MLEKIEAYLNKNGIELPEFLTPDLLMLNSLNSEIINWGFDIKQPSKEDLKKIKPEDIKQNNDKKEVRRKFREFKKSKIPVLKKEEVEQILDKLEVGDNFICKNRLYIIVASTKSGNDVLASYPNDINKDFNIMPDGSNFVMT